LWITLVCCDSEGRRSACAKETRDPVGGEGHGHDAHWPDGRWLTAGDGGGRYNPDAAGGAARRAAMDEVREFPFDVSIQPRIAR